MNRLMNSVALVALVCVARLHSVGVKQTDVILNVLSHHNTSSDSNISLIQLSHDDQKANASRGRNSFAAGHVQHSSEYSRKKMQMNGTRKYSSFQTADFSEHSAGDANDDKVIMIQSKASNASSKTMRMRSKSYRYSKAAYSTVAQHVPVSLGTKLEFGFWITFFVLAIIGSAVWAILEYAV